MKLERNLMEFQMKRELINSAEDMAWLRETHIPTLPPQFKSAIINVSGAHNEDAPDSIECFESPHPTVTDIPLVYTPDGDGVYICI